MTILRAYAKVAVVILFGENENFFFDILRLPASNNNEKNQLYVKKTRMSAKQSPITLHKKLAYSYKIELLKVFYCELII